MLTALYLRLLELVVRKIPNTWGHGRSNRTGNAAFGYDGNGNPTEYKGFALTFDPENRMTSYGSAEANGYNANGLRSWTEGSSGAKTYFLYDGDTAICELTSIGAVTATNTYGADGLVSRRTSNGSEFYDFDLSGNTAERLTTSGAVASSDMTDAFGKRKTTDTTDDPFAFSGQWGGYTDSATGLVLLEHRYYDPSAGRWVTRDPIGYAGGVNVYGYCGNQSVDKHDQTGWMFAPLYPPENPIGKLWHTFCKWMDNPWPKVPQPPPGTEFPDGDSAPVPPNGQQPSDDNPVGIEGSPVEGTGSNEGGDNAE